MVSKGADSDLKPGCLLVLVSSLEVRDTSCQLIHRFERNEIDEIKVYSPYEVTVRQRFIGKPDVCYRLLSAKMPEAMSVLEMQYKKKVEFTSQYTAYKASPVSSPCDGQGTTLSEGMRQTPGTKAVRIRLTTKGQCCSVCILECEAQCETFHLDRTLMSHFTLIASVAVLCVYCLVSS